MSHTLLVVAWLSLAIAAGCALAIAYDLLRGNRQHMWIMNLVWPVTALWAGPLGLWAYLRYGRAGAQRAMREAKEQHRTPPSQEQPFPVHVAKGATHCGSGCTLGDIAAELVFLAAPFTLFGHKMFGAWIYDYVAAFFFGILFQYFTIKPMRHVSAGKGLVAAIKADALSLTAWQLGMYGFMAIATFVIFRRELSKGSPVFWFMMQLAMIAGFLTSYPVNWWLLRAGVKERM